MNVWRNYIWNPSKWTVYCQLVQPESPPSLEPEVAEGKNEAKRSLTLCNEEWGALGHHHSPLLWPRDHGSSFYYNFGTHNHHHLFHPPSWLTGGYWMAGELLNSHQHEVQHQILKRVGASMSSRNNVKATIVIKELKLSHYRVLSFVGRNFIFRSMTKMA